MTSIDPDGALLLAAAVASQWLREQPHELPAVAAWLGLPADVLRRRLHPPAPRQTTPNGWRCCPACGAVLPAHNNGTRGRQRRYCSDRCRKHIGNMKARTKR